MKAHVITLIVVDHDEIGAKAVREVIETTTYPNRCILPRSIHSETIDIGEWDDDHPFNGSIKTLKDFQDWSIWRIELERARKRYESLKTSFNLGWKEGIVP